MVSKGVRRSPLVLDLCMRIGNKVNDQVNRFEVAFSDRNGVLV